MEGYLGTNDWWKFFINISPLQRLLLGVLIMFYTSISNYIVRHLVIYLCRDFSIYQTLLLVVLFIIHVSYYILLYSLSYVLYFFHTLFHSPKFSLSYSPISSSCHLHPIFYFLDCIVHTSIYTIATVDMCGLTRTSGNE